MWVWVFVFLGGFLLGVGTLSALEAFGVYFLIRKLNQKSKVEDCKLSEENDGSSCVKDLDPHQSLDFAYNKKGFLWVLELDKVPRNWLVEKASKESKKKKEFFEVTPVRKHAKIRDRSLILTESDGSIVAILLKGCEIEAVSATSLPSRKWAKRFPIKLENKTSAIYNSSKIVYIYLETSWEKESWCKALRLASSDDKEKLNWFTKLNEDFHCYLSSLNHGYPSFMKPSAGFNAEPMDRMSRFDNSGSKVRLFLKKLARKALEHKGMSLLGRDERKLNEKIRSINDPILTNSIMKTASAARMPVGFEEDNMELPSSSYSCSSSHSHVSAVSDLDCDEKSNVDEGTLCWNLLISRLFFDAKGNTDMMNSVKARIQRSLSNMRIPSYIGEVICTDMNLGNLPPYIHGIRVLPTDMNEAWAWEVDIEYCGGLVLDIETRLEVRDLDIQKGIIDESTSVGDVSPDLLEGFEYIGNQLSEVSEGRVNALDQTNAGDPKLDGLKNSKSSIASPQSLTAASSTTTATSRWKSILNSVAKQVQQLPISLSIRIASLRGTVRFHIKPPPSDQLWLGFTSMPDIEFELASSIGEHKITSGRVAMFLINRFKNSIRESMVLPNCETVFVPFMLAEKDDWVPRSVAPFMWLHQEATTDHATEPGETKVKVESIKEAAGGQNTSNSENTPPSSDLLDTSAHIFSTTKPPLPSSKSSEDIRAPLLTSGESQEPYRQSREYASENQSPSRSLKLVEQLNHASEEDDSKPKKLGTRARMLDLGKKMGEKLEEKKRHFESKGRNIVEKMRGTER